ncbi:MAG: aldose 1-epimerase family protein, partial [Pedobacter sp.]
NTYEFQGQTYHLSRHGFASDMEFSYEKLSEAEISFKLVHTEETLKNYPFEFELTISYRLQGSSLKCTYQVFNPDDKEMLFSIGGHPAFAAPLNGEGVYTDYYLQFNEDDEITYHLIEENLISDKTTTVQLKDRMLPLTHELFYGDALVFKNLKSNQIRLLNTKNYNGINFHFENFPFFGIWAAIDANFVCLEPWCGIADGVNHNKKLEEKEGIEKLLAGETWERSWEVCCF